VFASTFYRLIEYLAGENNVVPVMATTPIFCTTADRDIWDRTILQNHDVLDRIFGVQQRTANQQPDAIHPRCWLASHHRETALDLPLVGIRSEAPWLLNISLDHQLQPHKGSRRRNKRCSGQRRYASSSRSSLSSSMIFRTRSRCSSRSSCSASFWLIRCYEESSAFQSSYGQQPVRSRRGLHVLLLTRRRLRRVLAG